MSAQNSRLSGERRDPVVPKPPDGHEPDEPDVSGDNPVISSIWHRIRTEHITTLLLVGIMLFAAAISWYGVPWIANEIKDMRKEDKEDAKAAIRDEKEAAKIVLERYQLTHEKDQLRIVEALKDGNEKTAAAIRENSDSLKDLAREVKVFTEAYRESLRPQPNPRSP